ncbi:MAG: hypothetical protein IMZ66_05085 [Planctomycetes bacterium]|nr:hypothetical protein [Planctomycetota bacterium]
MRRVAWLAILMVLALTTRGVAQQVGTIENLREKPNITPEDRDQIRRWVDAVAKALATNTDPDRRGMVSARNNLIYEGRPGPGRSPAFSQAFAEEAVAALTATEKKAISQEARVNLLMVVAELRSLDGIPMLRTALEKDPYQASRYWAAKGLLLVAPEIMKKVDPRKEAEISDSIEKILDSETSSLILLQAIETLGLFEHDRAHDVLATAVTRIATRWSAADAVVARMLDEAVPALEKAYAREVRPQAKTQLLTAYATLCVWLIPPLADNRLMANLNASLEKITGEKVGFVATDDDVMQKLALLEWAERLVKTKRIPKRPAMPPVVEEVVKELTDADTSAGDGAAE